MQPIAADRTKRTDAGRETLSACIVSVTKRLDHASSEMAKQRRAKEPVATRTPRSAAPPRHSKKSRHAPDYEKKNVRQQMSAVDEYAEFFSVRETEQWRSDLAELPSEGREAFIREAHVISRKEVRKPLGSSHGRTFYSLPLGPRGRLVYSVDSGIAVLEHAFGKPSHSDEFRKFRKDVRQGRV